MLAIKHLKIFLTYIVEFSKQQNDKREQMVQIENMIRLKDSRVNKTHVSHTTDLIWIPCTPYTPLNTTVSDP